MVNKKQPADEIVGTLTSAPRYFAIVTMCSAFHFARRDALR